VSSSEYRFSCKVVDLTFRYAYTRQRTVQKLGKDVGAEVTEVRRRMLRERDAEGVDGLRNGEVYISPQPTRQSGGAS